MEVDKGKIKEWDKLLKTGAIKVHIGKDAERLKREIPPERFLESRFVKTRRANPENPKEIEIKCRWCVKGFRDPDLFEVDRQLPTLSMDALMMILQVIVSKGWQLGISDVEGAFLQGT